MGKVIGSNPITLMRNKRKKEFTNEYRAHAFRD